MKQPVCASLAFYGISAALRWSPLRQMIPDVAALLHYRTRSLFACPQVTFCGSVLQFQSRGIYSNVGFLDDDFVDIDAPTERCSSQVEPNDRSPTSTTTTPKIGESDVDKPVLGVVHKPPEEPGAEYSRFYIPLETPRGGKAIPRYDSRSLRKPGEKSHEGEEEMGGTHATPPQNGGVKDPKESEPRDFKSPLMPKDLLDSTTPDGDDITAHLIHSRMPEPSSLPYDDEAFAEMLLQMEVDGVIDEVWQDAQKAHVEDVKELCEVLRSLKVRDICCIDVSDKTASFDYIVSGTCEGPRHIHIASWAAQESDSLHRISKVSRKKTDELWEVVPIGRILLNLMVESLREELALERKWVVTRTMDPLSAANAPVCEGRHAKAHGLWTLTMNLQDLEDFEVDYCKDVLLSQA
ncbi:unnamed protein product [Phytomonas sp. Hart1]|nr:unnamed protein product [Phytomonas sp. Hart1]|eukprot:CCW68086.1 unnamed protein product [Phytomonas sp. isolate Hart1]